MLSWAAHSLGFNIEFAKKIPWHNSLVEMVSLYKPSDLSMSIRGSHSRFERESFRSLLQVDFRDFGSVNEWRSPAIIPKCTVPQPFIDDKWKETVTLAHRALKIWGENSIVPVSNGSSKEDEIFSCANVPLIPPNSLPNKTRQVG